MKYIKFLNTKIYEWMPRHTKWKIGHLTRKGGALIDRIKWCQDIIFSDCSRIEVHIMCKEYSNTLRKRGMNVLGKVVGQQQTLCTGNTRPLTFFTGTNSTLIFITWLWHIKTWDCYQTDTTLHLYWPYVCPFGKFYYCLHMIKET